MGRYLNPQDVSKETWLKTEAIFYGFDPPKKFLDNTGNIAVCLVDNGRFSAAALCNSQEELVAFSRPDDHRFKYWYFVKPEDQIHFR